ncbi:MAG: hypothetical protein JOZ00_15610 [Mycobacterium sp.]|uniref:hypothetical protein n=1 Tax=Mycobacterium sp. TaxID=1785 RepID=UPI001EB7A6E0|nr:hypothetical protein [Mycobacterium sp.]MBV8788103.1 hypothetical protein [Mycobacterium sp.]
MAHTDDPYQAQAAVGDASTCPQGQCYFTFPQVPAGKRLKLTSVSAQLGDASDVIVLEGAGAVAYFVTKCDRSLGYLTQVVSFFYEAGDTPTARVYVGPNYTEHTSLIITLVGILENT